MLRVCVEFLPPRDLARADVVRLLLQRNIAPMLALRPSENEGEALAALKPYADAGLAACAWPLLDDAAGYWPSTGNVALFAERVHALLDAAARDGVRLPWMAVDLEPPLAAVERVRAGAPLSCAADLVTHARSADGRDRFTAAEQAYAALHKEMLRRNTRAVAIAWPPAAADFSAHGAPTDGMQRLCAAPLRCGWDRVAVMVYGSMIAGYSKGALSVADARWYGYRALTRLVSAIGQRAGAYVGIVGHGKLGDEPHYDDPAELGRDVAAARAAGVGEIGLFCLEGVLGSRNPEAWLDALVDGARQAPRFAWRGELLHRSMIAGASALAVL